MSTEVYKNLYKAEIYSQRTKDNIGLHLIGQPISDSHRQALNQFRINNNLEKVKLEEEFDIKNYDFLKNREKPIYVIDSYDYIYCRYCLKFVKVVAPVHLFKHNLTSWMYHQLFPEAPMIARSVVNRVISKGMKTKTERGDQVGRSYGYGGFRKDIGHYTRSIIEANFCRILILNEVKYEYEPVTFKLDHEIYSSYTPDIRLKQDFYVWKTDEFLELKNQDMDQENIDKMNVFYDRNPSVVLHVLFKSDQDVVNLERLYKHKILLWETDVQNIVKTPQLYI
jgi:hypothetical protein